MSNDTEQAGTDLATMDPGLLQQFAQMANLIPAEDSGGVEKVVAQILGAATWEELDDPWESSNAEALAGKRLKFLSVQRRASDFRSGLRIFLVCQCVDIDSGEQVVVTTSAVSVIAQLARAHAIKAMPIIAEFVIAERPSKNGFHPHHLKVLGSAAQVTTDAGA